MESTWQFVMRSLEFLLLGHSTVWSDQQGSSSIKGSARRKNWHLDGGEVQGPTFRLPKVVAVHFVILEKMWGIQLHPYIEGIMKT